MVIRPYHGWASRALLCMAVAVGTGVLAACGMSPHASATASASPPPASPTASPPDDTLVANYLPGLPAQLRLPTADGPAPLIVMVPGGSWSTADPTGLIPLAARLTQDGSSTALITYATTGGGSTFPEAVDDVACAVRWSVRQATSRGRPPTRLIVLGHSAGGHLASLVAFSGQEFGGTCPYPPVDIDGLVGLAGVYDTDQLRPVLSEWMGINPTEGPDMWRRANPLAWLHQGTHIPHGLRVLLLHGDADASVPLAQTTALAEALAAARIEVRTTILPGLGHLEIFDASHAGPAIHAWMGEWSAQEASAGNPRSPRRHQKSSSSEKSPPTATW